MKYIVIFGSIVQLLGIFSYIKEILRGNTIPNRVTWLLWSLAPLIAATAAFYDGVRWAALPVFFSGLGPLLVFITSFLNKKRYWKLEKFDYTCGLCSLLALILWGITKQPIVAIVFALISDGLATIPTLLKSWKYPETESIAAYIACMISSLTSFAAIEIWNFSSYAFPAYLLIVNIVLVLSISRNKIWGSNI